MILSCHMDRRVSSHFFSAVPALQLPITSENYSLPRTVSKTFASSNLTQVSYNLGTSSTGQFQSLIPGTNPKEH